MPSLDCGKFYEPIAKQEYMNVVPGPQHKHASFKFESAGLFIHPLYSGGGGGGQ